MVRTGVTPMKIYFIWIVVLTAVGATLAPVATAWAQDKDEVPARATWRPQAPERPELPPGVERQEENFKVERPKISLPGMETDLEGAPEGEAKAEATSGSAAGPEAGAPAERETPPPDSAGDPPPPAPEPESEARAESPEPPAAVAVTTENRAERTPPTPVAGSIVQPEYPRDALLRGQEGYVALEFTVTAAGDVANVAITEAEPDGVFEDKVREAIRRWQFQPATQGGEPVDQRVRHRFDFNMDG